MARSPPGSSVHRILQVRILEWFPCAPPGDLPDPGIELGFPALQTNSLPSAQGRPLISGELAKYLRILLKCRFWFLQLGGPESLHFSQAPGGSPWGWLGSHRLRGKRNDRAGCGWNLQALVIILKVCQCIPGPALSALSIGAVMGGTLPSFYPRGSQQPNTQAAFCRGNGSAHRRARMKVQYWGKLTPPAFACRVVVNLRPDSGAHRAPSVFPGLGFWSWKCWGSTFRLCHP